MRLLLCALGVLAVLAAACSSPPQRSVAASAPPSQTATADPPTPTAQPVVAPLTGLPVTDEAQLQRPVLAVKIDNAPQARPQDGLNRADVVVTEVVEGGFTRFVALYHSQDPGAVGPVRSGRNVDAELLPPFQPVVAISGAAGPTYAVLRQSGLLLFEEGQADGGVYRVAERAAPHNLFANAAKLWAAAGELPAASAPWPFSEDVPAGGTTTSGAHLTYSQYYTADWTWDAGRGQWVHGQDGAPHVDVSGEPVTADTVLIPRVQTYGGGGIDSAGNLTTETQLVGEGELTVLREGQAFAGTWRKTSAGTHIEWLLPSGQAFPLSPGRTWVELLPVAGALTLDQPPAVPSPS